MKKLFLLLAIPLLIFACGESDTPEPAPKPPIAYIPNSTIEGKWYYISAVDSVLIIFENDRHTLQVWDKYTKNLIQKRDEGKYKLSKDSIYYQAGYALGYHLEENSLILYYRNGTESFTKAKED